MVDKLEALATAERAGLMRAALKGRISEVNAEIDDLRRQVAAREQDRDFFQAEDDKSAASYEAVVTSLVADGMQERKVREMLDVRVRMSVDANVEVTLPAPGGGKGRGSSPRRARSASKPETQGPDRESNASQRVDAGEGTATDAPTEVQGVEPVTLPEPGAAEGTDEGGLSLPPMGGE